MNTKLFIGEPDFAVQRHRLHPSEERNMRPAPPKRCPKEHPLWDQYWYWTLLPVRIVEQRCRTCDKDN